MLVPGQELSGVGVDGVVVDGEEAEKEVAGAEVDMVEVNEVAGEAVEEANEAGVDKPVKCVRRQPTTDLWTHSM